MLEGLDITPGKKIVIGNRGFVWVGDVESRGQTIVITNASNIRLWGTKNGLGEIAASGPTERTVLDPCPTLTMHCLSIVATMACNEEKWA